MDRWWDDFDKALDIAVRLDSNDAPEMLVGTALLVLHTIGKAAYDVAAHSFNPSDGFLEAPEVISNEALIGSVCKAFDDASGIPGYGATRVAAIKGEADAGARTLAASLRQDKVPWPLVCKRVGETYGLPASDVVPIRKTMGNSHELITGLAADRALLKWAAAISKAEATFSKAEDTFKVRGKERTVHRDPATGEFVSPGKTSAYMEEKKRSKGKQPKRKRPQPKEQEKEQEKKESPDWGRSAEVKSKETKEAERKAELEMRSERAARGSHGEAAFQEYLTEQRGIIAEQARQGHQAALGFEARRAAAQEAARQGIGQYRGRTQEKQQQQPQQRGEARQRLQVQRPQPKEEKKEVKIDRVFDVNDPSATTKTMMIDTGNAQTPVKVPQMYTVNQTAQDDEQDTDAVISMYTGIPEDELDDKAEYLDERLGNTIAWMKLMDKTGSGLGFLSDQVSEGTKRAYKEQITDLHDAIENFYESDEKKAVTDHTEVHQTISMEGSGNDEDEFIESVKQEIDAFIKHEMSTKDFLEMLHNYGHNDETSDSLVRALQIREMTATPDEFLPTTEVTVRPKGFEMLVSMRNRDTGEIAPYRQTLDDEFQLWGSQIAELIQSQENILDLDGADFHLELDLADRTPGEYRVSLTNRGKGFNDSGVLDAEMGDIGGADIPISPSSPVKSQLLADRPAAGASLGERIDQNAAGLKRRLGIEPGE